MSMSEFINQLTTPGAEEFDNTWCRFLFDVRAGRGLKVEQDVAKQIVASGAAWGGGGLTTSQASKRLYDTTGVALVADSVAQYKDCWLFALSMIWNLDISQLALSDRAAEGAFALATLMSESEDGEYQVMDNTATLDWEEEEEELHSDLKRLLARVAAGKKLEMRCVLESCPRFAGLPAKAPENNHRQDRSSQVDKNYRSLQNTILHLLRVFGSSYAAGQNQDGLRAATLFQQGWQLLYEAFDKINQLRKEYSVPGSTAAADEVLFGKDEVNNVTWQQKINNVKGI